MLGPDAHADFQAGVGEGLEIGINDAGHFRVQRVNQRGIANVSRVLWELFSLYVPSNCALAALGLNDGD